MEKEKYIYHKYFPWLLGAFVLLIYGTSFSVFLNGDDFMYGTFAHEGIVANVCSYYFTGNGRFWINVADSFLLKFDRYLFVVLLPWIVLSFVYLLAKNIQIITGGADLREYMTYGMVFFAAIDVLCLRETVYWITGMMNYLFPAVMFLLGYYWFQKSRVGQISGKQRLIYYVICLLASSSVEQFALMFVGIMTLYHLFDLVKKKRILLDEWVAYVLALIGLAMLIFAPGNFVRVDTQSKIQPPFIDNCWTLVFQNTFAEPAFPLVLMFSVAVVVFIKKKKSARVYRVYMLLPVVEILCKLIPQLHKAIVYTVLIFVLGILWLFRVFTQSKFKKEMSVLTFVGLGSQIMLLISVIWGYRCMFSMYMVYMLLIGVLLQDMTDGEKAFVLATGISCAVSPIVTLAYWAVWLWLYFTEKNNALSKMLIPVCTVVTMLSVCMGYGGNRSIYVENTAQSVSGNMEIELHQLPDETYSWYQIPLSEFHEAYYRRYYQLDDAKIIYIFDGEN